MGMILGITKALAKIFPCKARHNFLTLLLLVTNALLLLPSLLQSGKLSHRRGWMPAGLKLVLRVPLPLENRRVDCSEDKVVLRTRKVQQTESVDVALVFWRNRYLLS